MHGPLSDLIRPAELEGITFIVSRKITFLFIYLFYCFMSQIFLLELWFIFNWHQSNMLSTHPIIYSFLLWGVSPNHSVQSEPTVAPSSRRSFPAAALKRLQDVLKGDAGRTDSPAVLLFVFEPSLVEFPLSTRLDAAPPLGLKCSTYKVTTSLHWSHA